MPTLQVQRQTIVYCSQYIWVPLYLAILSTICLHSWPTLFLFRFIVFNLSILYHIPNYHRVYVAVIANRRQIWYVSSVYCVGSVLELDQIFRNKFDLSFGYLYWRYFYSSKRITSYRLIFRVLHSNLNFIFSWNNCKLMYLSNLLEWHKL